MASAANAFRDNTETVVLPCRGTTDTTKETLLDSSLELDNSHTGRGLRQHLRKSGPDHDSTYKLAYRRDFNGHLSDSKPRDEDAMVQALVAVPHKKMEGAHKTVMPIENQNSCAWTRL